MKTARSIMVGVWVIERLPIGRVQPALAGDLLEELHQGRSTAWFWQQVSTAIAMSAAQAAADLAPAALFSAAWSLLFPRWQAMSGGWLPRALRDDWLTLAWPRPALIELACGVLPAVSFVWLGILLYLMLRRRLRFSVSVARILGGFSASLNVLLGSTMLLLRHFHHPDLVCVTTEHFYFGYQFLGISLPLTLSVLSALLVADVRGPRPVRRRRVARRRSSGRLGRLAQSAGHRLSLSSGSRPFPVQ